MMRHVRGRVTESCDLFKNAHNTLDNKMGMQRAGFDVIII